VNHGAALHAHTTNVIGLHPISGIINRVLADADAAHSIAHIAPYMKCVFQAIDEIGCTRQQVQRDCGMRINDQPYAALRDLYAAWPARTIHFSTFVSASLDRSEAHRFVGRYGLIFEITDADAVLMMEFSQFTGEQVALVPCPSSWVLSSRHVDGNSRTVGGLTRAPQEQQSGV
jgi:hypothetical protein